MPGGVTLFLKREDGATAVEFSLIAVPFTLLLIAIVELSMFFAASSMIQGATEEAARLVRTGQVQQTNGDPQEMFENALCAHASVMANCDNIFYEVIRLDNFADFTNYPLQFDGDGNMVSQGFTPGGVNDVVLIRASYRYPLMIPLLANIFSDGPNNTRLIVATLVLQSEPYDLAEELGD